MKITKEEMLRNLKRVTRNQNSSRRIQRPRTVEEYAIQRAKKLSKPRLLTPSEMRAILNTKKATQRASFEVERALNDVAFVSSEGVLDGIIEGNDMENRIKRGLRNL